MQQSISDARGIFLGSPEKKKKAEQWPCQSLGRRAESAPRNQIPEASLRLTKGHLMPACPLVIDTLLNSCFGFGVDCETKKLTVTPKEAGNIPITISLLERY